MPEEHAVSYVNSASLDLVLTEQRRLGGEMGNVTKAISALVVENAKLPENVRKVMTEEMPRCPAYRYFSRHEDDIGDTTKSINVQAEQILALRERVAMQTGEIDRLRGRHSVPPKRTKHQWWQKMLIPIASGLGAAIATGAIAFQCSSTPARQEPKSDGGIATATSGE